LSDNPGLNSTANITFRNTGYIGQYPSLIHKMKRGSSRCNDCYNFSALTASTLVINTSNFGDGTISLGKAAISQSNVSLNTGWNLISLEMQNNDSGTQKNVTIVAGWNLIGYSSSINLSHSSVRFYNDTPGAVMTMTEASQRGYVQKYFGYLVNSGNLKKYQYVPKDVGNLTSQRGYWIYANTGVTGNITMPGVGGSPKNETYKLSDLMFRNGSGSEKNVSDAVRDGWVSGSDANTAVYYSYMDIGLQTWGNVKTEDYCAEDFSAVCNINSWQGYMIYLKQSNVSLLRQN